MTLHDSPQPATPEDLLLIGRLGQPQGLRGEVRMTNFMRALDEAVRLLEASENVWLRPAKQRPEDVDLEPHAYPLEGVRIQSGRVILALVGLEDRTAIENLPRGLEVLVDRSAAVAALGEDEFLDDDIIGREAVSPTGQKIGEIVDVALGPQDLLVIQPDADWWTTRGNDRATEPLRRFSIPIKAPLVGHIAPGADSITIDVPPGLETIVPAKRKK